MKIFPLLFILFASSVHLLAQSDGDTLGRKSKVTKVGMFTPMIYPGYSPELGVSIGGGALWSFKTKHDEPDLLRSSVPIGITYGFKGAVSLKANWVTFWLRNKLRVYSDWYYRNMNDQYFGVGYDAGANTVQSDSTTAYKKDWFQFDTRVVYEIEPNLFLGLRIDLNKTIVSDPNPKMQEDPYYLEFGPSNYNTGLGVVMQHDTRDFPQNAYSGTYFSVFATFYSGALGGQNDYASLDLDFRKYMQLSDERLRILALWLRGKTSGGNVPYNELNQIGPNDLRGYYWGQYRDKSLGYILTEYRHKFYKSSGKETKSGFVTWLGVAAISPDFGLTESRNALPNAGVGFRYELQPRLNVRLDYGFGFDTQLFYVGFAEHF